MGRSANNSLLNTNRRGVIERRVAICCLVFLACLFAVITEHTFAQLSVSEYNLKSAYIYSFGNYTNWSQTASSQSSQTPPPELIIGVYGDSPITERLHEVAQKRKIKGRQIRVTRPKTQADIDKCAILFVPQSVPLEDQKRLLREQAGKPILVVGEVPQFLDMGGMVEFRLQETTVKFDININATKQSKLILNAKLLRLASPRPVVEVAPIGQEIVQ